MAGWSDEVVLIKRPTNYADGFTTPGPPERTPVYANQKSVARSEFYAAKAAGIRTDVIYEVNAMDFDGHTELEADGTTYSIVRSYQATSDTVELTCARR